MSNWVNEGKLDMARWQHWQARGIFLGLIVTLSGCRPLGGPLTFQSPGRGNEDVQGTAAASKSTKPGLLPEGEKAEVQIAMARTMEHQGRSDEAKKIYQEVIRREPGRSDALHYLALLLDHQGECAAAEEHYRQALRFDAHNPELHCDHGYSLYLQQRWPEAEASLRQALALDPDHRRAHNNFGLLLARTGREQEALGAFAKAGCSQAEARANLAFAMTLGERWNDAQQQFQSALAADPNLQVAREGSQALQAVAAKRTSNARPAPASLPTGGVTQASYVVPPPVDR